MTQFNKGDRVTVIQGGGGEQVGTEGTVTRVQAPTNGDGEFVYFDTDSGRTTGLFAFRLRKVAKPVDDEFIKQRDEALSKVEDALDVIKKRVLSALSDFLDNNARR